MNFAGEARAPKIEDEEEQEDEDEEDQEKEDESCQFGRNSPNVQAF